MNYDFKPEDIAVTAWPLGQCSGLIHKQVHGIRAIHLPTGTVVTCETERSQHRNREIALQQLWDQVKDKPTYKELDVQVQQLRAHNEMLMQASWEMKEGVPDAFYKIKNIRNTTPAQCLAEVKAQAFEDGGSAQKAFWDGFERGAINGAANIRAHWNEYLQIRQQAKAGKQ